jgi:hypothetical protein
LGPRGREAGSKEIRPRPQVQTQSKSDALVCAWLVLLSTFLHA